MRNTRRSHINKTPSAAAKPFLRKKESTDDNEWKVVIHKSKTHQSKSFLETALEEMKSLKSNGDIERVIDPVLQYLEHKECDTQYLVKFTQSLGNFCSNLSKRELRNIKNFIEKSSLLTVIEKKASAFDSSELNDVLWGLSEIGFNWKDLSNRHISSRLFSSIQNRIDDYTLADTTTTLWALAKQKILKTNEPNASALILRLIEKIKNHIHQGHDDKLANHVPTLFWSLSILGFSEKQLADLGLFHYLLDSIQHHAANYAIKDLIKSLQAFVLLKQTVNTCSKDIVNALLCGIKAQPIKYHIPTLLWELARFGLTFDLLKQANANDFIHRIEQELINNLDKLSLNHFAILLWSFAVLSGENPGQKSALVEWIWSKISFDQIKLEPTRSCYAMVNQLCEASEYFGLTLPQEIPSFLKTVPAPKSSQFHQDVAAILIPILHQFGADEIVQEKQEGSFFLDLATRIKGKKLDFEFNGPLHYDNQDLAFSHDHFREILLKKKGYTIVPISYKEWGNHLDKEAYLKNLVQQQVSIQSSSKNSEVSLFEYLLTTGSWLWQRSPNKVKEEETATQQNRFCQIL